MSCNPLKINQLSEEHIASIFRVEGKDKQRASLNQAAGKNLL
jgi:hypothetical protein